MWTGEMTTSVKRNDGNGADGASQVVVKKELTDHDEESEDSDDDEDCFLPLPKKQAFKVKFPPGSPVQICCYGETLLSGDHPDQNFRGKGAPRVTKVLFGHVAEVGINWSAEEGRSRGETLYKVNVMRTFDSSVSSSSSVLSTSICSYSLSSTVAREQSVQFSIGALVWLWQEGKYEKGVVVASQHLPAVAAGESTDICPGATSSSTCADHIHNMLRYSVQSLANCCMVYNGVDPSQLAFRFSEMPPKPRLRSEQQPKKLHQPAIVKDANKTTEKATIVDLVGDDNIQEQANSITVDGNSSVPTESHPLEDANTSLRTAHHDQQKLRMPNTGSPDNPVSDATLANDTTNDTTSDNQQHDSMTASRVTAKNNDDIASSARSQSEHVRATRRVSTDSASGQQVTSTKSKSLLSMVDTILEAASTPTEKERSGSSPPARLQERTTSIPRKTLNPRTSLLGDATAGLSDSTQNQFGDANRSQATSEEAKPSGGAQQILAANSDPQRYNGQPLPNDQCNAFSPGQTWATGYAEKRDWPTWNSTQPKFQRIHFGRFHNFKEAVRMMKWDQRVQPHLKAFLYPRCLAWHLYGKCYPNCNRKDDHEPLSTEEALNLEAALETVTSASGPIFCKPTTSRDESYDSEWQLPPNKRQRGYY
ncbi:expressed unknown protein [Seminavis robusta]|uniref:Uncharacterized protein n=1 Tax=Seminavis robusta TaxID=568900 RepID=A0A9N8EX91_9STRA|nr:expressed unknown protein [Seminavis robusta]|eukprot:Sro1824_g299990.1 n/a (650) ;mRNA; f:4903-6852